MYPVINCRQSFLEQRRIPGTLGASVQLSQLFCVYYSIRDLDIEQDDGLEFQDDQNYLNEWGLAINTEIPVSLNATLPAGESGLDLSDLNLESFTMQIGA